MAVEVQATRPPGPDTPVDERPLRPSAPHAPAKHAWLACLVLGVLAICGYYLLPRGGVAQPVEFCAINAGAACAAFTAAARARRDSRLVWCALGAAMTLSTLAQIPNYFYPLVTGSPIPFPSPLDAVWLCVYSCLMIALAALARHGHGGQYGGRLLDTAILIVGGDTLLWVFLVAPVLHTAGLPSFAHIVYVLYPIMDVLVFSLLVRLIVGSQRTPALHLLVASCFAMLVSDALYAHELAVGSYQVGGPTDALWMLGYLLIAVAALHPTARSFPKPPLSDDYRLTAPRLAFLGVALLVGPILLLSQPRDVVLISCSSAVSFLLVMSRMAWLNRRFASASAAVKTNTEQLRFLALHDPLTGLANRALLMDRMQQMLARNRRNGTETAALYVDLDRFKNINDTLGHAAGDALLTEVANRLTNSLREVDTIARIGGDEFVVLLNGAAHGTPRLIAERLLDVMRRPFSIAGSSTVITTSVGIAADLDSTPTQLLHDADMALYEAKAAGKNCYEIFHAQLNAEAQRRHSLEYDLRLALAEDQYRLVYQPIYDLDHLTLTGVEALLRWQHPGRGQIQPDEFIPLLEANGRIVEVGRWVLHEACTQAARWRADGHDLRVSVNVSAPQLDRASIVDEVAAALQSSGLDPAALIIEVTETALMRDLDVTAARLRGLKALGVQIAIDDFGTGYSSLAYLQSFPVDSIKIDRVFVTAIATSRASDVLIHTLIKLGKDLGLRTLAEGVETTAQLAHLRGEGVGQIQGFLLARPADLETLERDYLNLSRPINRERVAAD